MKLIKLFVLALFIVFAFLATGCTSVPVEREFPEVPVTLLEKCPQLKTIDSETTVFSILINTVVQNYSTYYDCAVRQDAWIEWYQTQKKIFKEVK
jgi:hypothetical protein